MLENLRGCEHVFINDIAKKWNFLMVNIPLRKIHRQEDNLSNAESLIKRSYDIAKSYEIVIKNHRKVLKNEPGVVFYYLIKAIYRYGIAGSRKDVWRVYKNMIKHSKKISDYFVATGLLIIGLMDLREIERLRVNRINKKLLRRA